MKNMNPRQSTMFHRWMMDTIVLCACEQDPEKVAEYLDEAEKRVFGNRPIGSVLPAREMVFGLLRYCLDKFDR